MTVKREPYWYKDAIIYQLHVRSFYDSDGDGIGDFKGLIKKLDYIENLGVNTIWLLPFYPSPLRDGGYDIAAFTGIHPDYGTLADFKRFVKEAHKRGLRIITELVLNHTSSEHKWFQRARRAKPGSVARDFYVWSDDPDKYADARIIFQDFEVSNWTYDHMAGAYYWHRFYSHQPDLNFENPRVQQEILKVLDFWFQIGVDGFRLDAVPYLYEAEGTNCENLPETHAYLKKLRKHVDDRYDNRLLLAEANQWPGDAREYFGDGDECHMAFHFPVMPRLFMALRMEDRFPVVDILEQTPDIPENCQWATFLRNHDELTLEMVTDEERDYMYRAFAKDPRKRVNVGIRRRLFPLLGGDTRTIEVLNVLLLSLPGTPIIYYGDEIGMGDNYYLGDRDGVRTPMQWSPDKNAGFSNADPQQLFLPLVIDPHHHYTSVNVENQEKNPSSFLWWKRRVIAKRRQYKAFGRGSLQFVNTNNPKILAFIRAFGDETILVVVNLSRYSQHVELDLSDFAGNTPVEVFSRNEFPVISDEPWSFSMQFKNYFWFELRPPGKKLFPGIARDNQRLDFSQKEWDHMTEELQHTVKNNLYDYLVQIKWFSGDTRKLRNIEVLDVIHVENRAGAPWLFIVRLDLIEAANDIYLMPVSLALNNRANWIKTYYPDSVIAPLVVDGTEGVIYDGSVDKKLHEVLFDLLRRRSQLKGLHGIIKGKSGSRLKKLLNDSTSLSPHLITSKHTNSSVVYGDNFFLKIYRSPQEGENPEVEIMKNLTRHTSFTHIPSYLGRLEYRSSQMENTSMALLMELIPNVGTAWDMTQTSIDRFFDKLLSERENFSQTTGPDAAQLDELIGPFYLEMASLLGQRTAEMHLALASLKDNFHFRPEKFSLLYQKSLYQSLRSFTRRTFNEIRSASGYPEKHRDLLLQVLESEDLFLSAARSILENGKIDGMKVRLHGNYKLDKVLFTGKDFKFINFEGELEREWSVRRIKHSPVKDVASLLSSFHFSIYKGYFSRMEFIPSDGYSLLTILELWYHRVADRFLSAYMDTARPADLIPGNEKQFQDLLNIYMYEKAVHELKLFMQDDPDYMVIPLKILQRIRRDSLGDTDLRN
ncbi:MAG: maltose alpha-D-glucosyltransferase [Bacteroidales bacterium]